MVQHYELYANFSINISSVNFSINISSVNVIKSTVKNFLLENFIFVLRYLFLKSANGKHGKINTK